VVAETVFPARSSQSIAINRCTFRDATAAAARWQCWNGIDHEDEQANQPPPVPLTAQQLLERLIAKAKAAGMPVFCEDTSLGSMEKYVIISEAFIEFTAEKAQQRLPAGNSSSSTHSTFPACREGCGGCEVCGVVAVAMAARSVASAICLCMICMS
jgi:hypothetical protein